MGLGHSTVLSNTLKKKQETLKNGSTVLHVKRGEKNINIIVNSVLYLEKDLKLVCGSGHGKVASCNLKCWQVGI